MNRVTPDELDLDLDSVCSSYSLAKTSCVIVPHVAGRKIRAV